MLMLIQINRVVYSPIKEKDMIWIGVWLLVTVLILFLQYGWKYGKKDEHNVWYDNQEIPYKLEPKINESKIITMEGWNANDGNRT